MFTYGAILYVFIQIYRYVIDDRISIHLHARDRPSSGTENPK